MNQFSLQKYDGIIYEHDCSIDANINFVSTNTNQAQKFLNLPKCESNSPQDLHLVSRIPASIEPSIDMALIDSSETSTLVSARKSVLCIKPRRAFSAYNIFFRLQRDRIVNSDNFNIENDFFEINDSEIIRVVSPSYNGNGKSSNTNIENKEGQSSSRKHRKTHGKISFADLAKTVAILWKKIDTKSKDLLQSYAILDKNRFKKEMFEYNKKAISLCRSGKYFCSKSGVLINPETKSIASTSEQKIEKKKNCNSRNKHLKISKHHQTNDSLNDKYIAMSNHIMISGVSQPEERHTLTNAVVEQMNASSEDSCNNLKDMQMVSNSNRILEEKDPLSNNKTLTNKEKEPMYANVASSMIDYTISIPILRPSVSPDWSSMKCIDPNRISSSYVLGNKTAPSRPYISHTLTNDANESTLIKKVYNGVEKGIYNSNLTMYQKQQVQSTSNNVRDQIKAHSYQQLHDIHGNQTPPIYSNNRRQYDELQINDLANITSKQNTVIDYSNNYIFAPPSLNNMESYGSLSLIPLPSLNKVESYGSLPLIPYPSLNKMESYGPLPLIPYPSLNKMESYGPLPLIESNRNEDMLKIYQYKNELINLFNQEQIHSQPKIDTATSVQQTHRIIMSDMNNTYHNNNNTYVNDSGYHNIRYNNIVNEEQRNIKYADAGNIYNNNNDNNNNINQVISIQDYLLHMEKISMVMHHDLH